MASEPLIETSAAVADVEPRVERVAAKPAAKRKTKPARRAKPGERGAALIDADLERGSLVAGADEAGRGCLAGPLVAAAVLLRPADLLGDIERKRGTPPRLIGELARLDDSKRVPKPHRDALAAAILERAVAVAVIVRSAQSIDRDGLHRTNIAMLGEALDRVRVPGSLTLSDGFPAPLAAGGNAEALIGGDGRSAAIAAASVLAKVVRDKTMREHAHERWPEHRFDEHVGYATPVHHAAIRESGITVIHRRSFASVAYEDAV